MKRPKFIKTLIAITLMVTATLYIGFAFFPVLCSIRVIASIIGGIGNIYGGVLGAFLLGFIENFGIWKISGEWKDAIAFGVLIIFLLFRPQGILKK